MYPNQSRALDAMERNGLDGLVVTTPTNLYYVSNFRALGTEFDAFAVLPRSSAAPPTLGVGHRGVVFLAANPTPIPNIITFEQPQFANVFPQPGAPYQGFFPTTRAIEAEIRRLLKEAHNTSTSDGLEALTYCLRDLGLEKARLGFDDLEVAQLLRERYLPNLQARGARELFWQIRLVKTDEEVQIMREGARIHQEALQEAFDAACVGVDVAELAHVFSMALVKRGSMPVGGIGFYTGPTEVALSAQLHNVLKKGDVLVGAGMSNYRSYNVEIGRTIAVGPPSRRQATVHMAVAAAFNQAESLIRPGLKTNEIFRCVMETVSREGGDVDKLGIYCHSIGLDVLEFPHHIQREGFVLEPNVCLCLYIFHKGPNGEIIALEDQFLVTDGGRECLATMPRHLIEVA